MPAINFSKFVDKVENGTKTITIRNNYPRVSYVGCKIKLYSGQRTKNCRLLGETTIKAMKVIRFNSHIFEIEKKELDLYSFYETSPIEKQEIILKDGFSNYQDFLDFHFMNAKKYIKQTGVTQLTMCLIEFEPLIKI